jgi:hypothetical protein
VSCIEFARRVNFPNEKITVVKTFIGVNVRIVVEYLFANMIKEKYYVKNVMEIIFVNTIKINDSTRIPDPNIPIFLVKYISLA